VLKWLDFFLHKAAVSSLTEFRNVLRVSSGRPVWAWWLVSPEIGETAGELNIAAS